LICFFRVFKYESIFTLFFNIKFCYEIIEKGFAFEEVIKKAQENADELKALEEKFKIKK